MGLLSLFLHAILVENLVLSYGLGLDQVLHRKQGIREALILGSEATIVLSVLGVLFWLLYRAVLVTLQLEFLATFFGLLLLASFGLLWDWLAGKFPDLLPTGGAYSPFYLSPVSFGFLILLTTKSWSLPEVLLFSLASGIALGLVSVMVYVLRTRMRLENLPKLVQGEPLLFFTLGLISLGFSLFDRVIDIPLLL